MDYKPSKVMHEIYYMHENRTHILSTECFLSGGLDVLRTDLIDKARKMTRVRSDNHPWQSMDDEELLRSAGLILMDRESRKEGITLAAILLYHKLIYLCFSEETDMIKNNTKIHSAEQNVILNILIYEPDASVKKRGVIQIVHGMTEHMARYEEFAEYFTMKGFVVLGNDIISHGRSVHERSEALYIEDWFHAVSDISSVKKLAKELYPELPVFILGFSLGSFLVRSMDSLDDYKGRILIGTGQQPTAVLGILRFYLNIKYRRKMTVASREVSAIVFDNYNNSFRGFPANYWLLTDGDKRKAYMDNKLVKRNFSPRFLCEFIRGMIYTNKKKDATDNSIPTLFIYGENDPVSGFGKGIKKVYRKYHNNNPKTKLIKISGKTHDILHDADAERVFRHIEKFMEYYV